MNLPTKLELPKTPDVDAKPRKRRWRFSLRTAFVAMVFIGLIFAGVHYVLEAYKVELRRPTANDFKTMGFGLMNFNDVHESLPNPVWRGGSGMGAPPMRYDPAGKPLSSWRCSILPYFCGGTEFNSNEAWDSVDNSMLNHAAYDSFKERTLPLNPTDPTSFHTKILAITGPGTAFGDGLLERPRKLGDIDGDTILAVETANSGLHWMEPGDFDIRTMPRTINDPSGRGISSRHKTGFHVLFADGSVWYLSNKTPFDELEKFFTVEGAKTYDRDAVLGRYVLTR